MRRTIRSSGEIDELFRTGQKGTAALVLVMCRPAPEERGPAGRVAFIAGKKLGGATVRNRAKRVLRASAARLGGPWPGRDVLVVGRSGVVDARASEVDKALETALYRAGVLNK